MTSEVRAVYDFVRSQVGLLAEGLGSEVVPRRGV